MTKTCPACGFVSAMEARFCRMCGAMLPRASEDDAVSPLAATIPLSAERPTATDELSPHDTGSPNRARTSSIAGGEMADFLRRGGEPSEPARPASTDTAQAAHSDAHDHSTELGERPLTINVRPIDAEVRATPVAPPPRHNDSARLADSNSNSNSNPSTPLVIAADSGAHVISSTAPVASDDDERTVVTPSARAPRSTEDRAIRLWAGVAVFGVVAVVTAAVVLLTWFAVQRYRRAHAPVVAGSTAASVPVTNDARQTASAKLVEADQLLAAGRADEAVARLREAAAADPSNAEPHRRLARLLIEEGARRTAIEELRAVVSLDATDAAAWRDLAAAQAGEGLYADAAESYHRLFGIAPEATRDDRLQLAYADALRSSGQTAQAQSIYKRLTSSGDAEVSRASREQLAATEEGGRAKNANAVANANVSRVAEATPVNSSNAAAQVERDRIEVARVNDADKNSAAPRLTPTALPADASPAEHYQRGSQLWRANRAAATAEFAAAAQGGNADANYYLGLSLAEGRDPRALKRGELVAALSYFQRARRSRFSSEARRYEDSLGREYDRRRASGQN